MTVVAFKSLQPAAMIYEPHRLSSFVQNLEVGSWNLEVDRGPPVLGKGFGTSSVWKT